MSKTGLSNTRKSFIVNMLNKDIYGQNQNMLKNDTEKLSRDEEMYLNYGDICKHDEFCGGCIYQNMSYEQQLKTKNGEVLKLLADKEIKYDEYFGIEPSPEIYGYRNKMEYTFGDMVKDGELTLGMHQKKKFMSIVTVDECQLVDEDFNAILRATLDFCKDKGYSFYNKKSHIGLLRHLILRKGVRTNELLINIVTSSQGSRLMPSHDISKTNQQDDSTIFFQNGFDSKEYVNVLLNLKLNNNIVGILNTINDRLSDAVYCDKLNVLYGRDYYMERIMELDFKVSAFSFFQTNVRAAERLYVEAISWITDFKDKTIFDLYCGTGTISQVLAQKAKKVIGIELVEDAVASAKENAEKNGLTNCEFIAGDVFEVMETLPDKPDLIVLDPPRVGVQPKALEKIVSYGVNRIVYISCNPKTFVENLYYLQYYGYKVEKVKAYDNFAFTKHCECVASLQKTS